MRYKKVKHAYLMVCEKKVEHVLLCVTENKPVCLEIEDCIEGCMTKSRTCLMMCEKEIKIIRYCVKRVFSTFPRLCDMKIANVETNLGMLLLVQE